jgi:CubicO group peptidase (beta-lactamase class C family)
MKKHLRILSIMIFLVSVLLPSCTPLKTNPISKNDDYFPTEEWRTSTPEVQGMDSALLKQMLDEVKTENHAVDSILVVRNGYIVWEEYPNDMLYDRNVPHVLYSATKSVMSALVGIAISKGYIKSVDQKVVDFFPDKTIANLDERKRNITVENLLMMTAGFEWNEISYGYSDPRNSVAQAMSSGDYVQYVLDRPMAYQPGETFVYNTGNTQVLSAIITKATGLSTDAFAQKYLFEPIGITSSYWNKDAQDIPLGGSGLELTPRDAAKFGYLFLNNGV